MEMACRGGMRTMMITGDYHYTATSVARRVGMIPHNGRVIIIQAESEIQPQTQVESVSQVKAEPLSEPLSKTHFGRVHEARAVTDLPEAKLKTAGSALKSKSMASISHSSARPSVSYTEVLPFSLGAPPHSSRAAPASLAGPQTQASSHFLSGQFSHSLPGHPQHKPGHPQQESGHPQQEPGHCLGQNTGHPQDVGSSPNCLIHPPLSLSGHPQQLSEHLSGHLPAAEGDIHSLLRQNQSRPGLHPGHPQTPTTHPQYLCLGLRLTLEGSQLPCQGDSASEALTSIAKGQAQCCITGTAFAQLLQRPDLSVLETVMQNVVVFARMQSHQKGQVMELLSSRGLHQVFRGQKRHIPVSSIYQ